MAASGTGAAACTRESPAARPRRGALRRAVHGGDDRGLITLEWLLIVGAVAGMAAAAVLVVQQVVDTAADAPDDPLVRVLEADIAAAIIAEEANEDAVTPPAARDQPWSDRAYGYERRCRSGLRSEYSDVIASLIWKAPRRVPPSPPDPQAPYTLAVPARCTATPRPNLGG